MNKPYDNDLIEAAIIGYEAQQHCIQLKLAELRARLAGKSVATIPDKRSSAKPVTTGKRVLSPAARKKIAAAQKKRWAAFHAQQQEATA